MSRENLIQTITVINEKSVKSVGFYHVAGELDLFVKDSLPDHINIHDIIKFLNSYIPVEYLKLIDVIYVGHLPEFDERKVNAVTKDGALFITNFQDNENDMIDDIVHEIAHVVEKYYNHIIYGDEQIKNEFLRKREAMRKILKYEGIPTEGQVFDNTEYDEDFDIFLYKKVGYAKLATLTQNTFASPYASTSLREYFADGFEDYYLGKRKNLKKVSPVLYYKLEEMQNEI